VTSSQLKDLQLGMNSHRTVIDAFGYQDRRGKSSPGRFKPLSAHFQVHFLKTRRFVSKSKPDVDPELRCPPSSRSDHAGVSPGAGGCGVSSIGTPSLLSLRCFFSSFFFFFSSSRCRFSYWKLGFANRSPLLNVYSAPVENAGLRSCPEALDQL
jgi:hypothetical protein